MSEFLEPTDDLEAAPSDPGERVRIPKPGVAIGTDSVEVFTQREYEGLGDRSGLGLGLAQITSRLLERLGTGGQFIPDHSVASSLNVQRDTVGYRVPRDDSPIVAWKRVVAVSATSRLMAIVCVPVQRASV